MTKSKFGLPAKQLEILFKIFSSYEDLDQVDIFGSRAKGNFHKLSDLDLVIRGKIETKINSIMGDISDSNFLFKVDIIGYSETKDNPLLKSEIDKYSKVFWSKEKIYPTKKPRQI